MKGAQVTVKTRAKIKRKNAVAPAEPEKAQDELEDPLAAVSYTHLTLPTNREV